jgi:hypothetical protein
MEWPHGTKEFVTVDVESIDDLTSSTVELGWTTDIDDPPMTWVMAGWPSAGINAARTSAPWDTALVDAGHWFVWIRITDSPEIILRKAGSVKLV